jgi:hypothetical protein
MSAVRDHRVNEYPTETIGKGVPMLASSDNRIRSVKQNEKRPEPIGDRSIAQIKPGPYSRENTFNDMKANEQSSMAPLGKSRAFNAMKAKIATKRSHLTNPGALDAWAASHG